MDEDVADLAKGTVDYIGFSYYMSIRLIAPNKAMQVKCLTTEVAIQ